MTAVSTSMPDTAFPREAVPYDSTGILTLPEAARELRCSTAQLYNILGGKVPDVPPLSHRAQNIDSARLFARLDTVARSARAGSPLCHGLFRAAR